MLSLFGFAGSVSGDEGGSLFDRELQKLRYDLSFESMQSNDGLTADQEDNLTLSDLAQADARPPQYKSPGKAFMYSLVVPGLGQYYSGSKIKPIVFLAVEVFGLSQAFKYHGNGDDITAEFEQFNRDHWNVDSVTYAIGDDDYLSYQAYLMSAYGTLRPDTLDDPDLRRGFTHILPDDKNQQYYEMTGKYHQFSWGWDDARLEGQTLEDLIADPDGVPITTGLNVPLSDNRLIYEGMRDNANKEYDKGMKMVFVIMGNHLISAFEAFFSTKRHNNRLKYNQPFSQINVKPSLRSYSAWKDTPYVTLTYKF
jgi:hypothetical protein